MDLDDVDARLVAALQRDGRASLESLGPVAGLSRTAVRARVDRLVRTGALRIVGVVHPEVQGLTAYGHVGVQHCGPAAAVARAVAALEDAPFVSIIAGRYGVIAELRCRDLDALQRAAGAVRSLETVRRVDVAVYTRIVKNAYVPPRPLVSVALDDVDWQLMALLQRDGRLPFAELGGRVRLSPSAARTRVLRLLDAGVLHIGGLLNPTLLGITEMCGFKLSVQGDAGSLVGELAQSAAVDFLALCIGRCDVVGTLIGRSRREVLTALESIRDRQEVRRVEAWTHLDLVKESYERQVPIG